MAWTLTNTSKPLCVFQFNTTTNTNIHFIFKWGAQFLHHHYLTFLHTLFIHHLLLITTRVRFFLYSSKLSNLLYTKVLSCVLPSTIMPHIKQKLVRESPPIHFNFLFLFMCSLCRVSLVFSIIQLFGHFAFSQLIILRSLII